MKTFQKNELVKDKMDAPKKRSGSMNDTDLRSGSMNVTDSGSGSIKDTDTRGGSIQNTDSSQNKKLALKASEKPKSRLEKVSHFFSTGFGHAKSAFNYVFGRCTRIHGKIALKKIKEISIETSIIGGVIVIFVVYEPPLALAFIITPIFGNIVSPRTPVILRSLVFFVPEILLSENAKIVRRAEEVLEALLELKAKTVDKEKLEIFNNLIDKGLEMSLAQYNGFSDLMGSAPPWLHKLIREEIPICINYPVKSSGELFSELTETARSKKREKILKRFENECLGSFDDVSKELLRREMNAIVNRVLPLSGYQNFNYRLTPIQLNGPPGIGKSYFVKLVSKIFGIPMTGISFGEKDIGDLLGHKSLNPNDSATPGLILKAMTDKIGNPSKVNTLIVFFDEIDKVLTNKKTSNPKDKTNANANANAKSNDKVNDKDKGDDAGANAIPGPDAIANSDKKMKLVTFLHKFLDPDTRVLTDDGYDLPVPLENIIVFLGSNENPFEDSNSLSDRITLIDMPPKLEKMGKKHILKTKLYEEITSKIKPGPNDNKALVELRRSIVHILMNHKIDEIVEQDKEPGARSGIKKMKNCFANPMIYEAQAKSIRQLKMQSTERESQSREKTPEKGLDSGEKSIRSVLVKGVLHQYEETLFKKKWKERCSIQVLTEEIVSFACGDETPESASFSASKRLSKPSKTLIESTKYGSVDERSLSLESTEIPSTKLKSFPASV